MCQFFVDVYFKRNILHNIEFVSACILHTAVPSLEAGDVRARTAVYQAPDTPTPTPSNTGRIPVPSINPNLIANEICLTKRQHTSVILNIPARV
ncbi:hypothetical protein G7K_1214-t1 [Saitoella complicata NRRL Y-17804]|uniref:Uncharacterized protein n=1 Tax=Saitoella complicata (strain BCRC 22490 / CBS 7301 / JCM 7358 / NBRC 10748 / NRRL Y-17804) TaxID=698492 RepID=A0A0E9NC66_SAICN|nr:hypothetical protein G7K_1214-t1 [Saitoella complicata NRRL Y-17804]